MKAMYGIVGTKFRPREAQDLFARLPSGAPLLLRREPTNEHDPFAVQVWAVEPKTRDAILVGYVKGTQNRGIAMAMDRERAKHPTLHGIWQVAGKLAVDGGKWPLVEVDEPVVVGRVGDPAPDDGGRLAMCRKVDVRDLVSRRFDAEDS